VPRRHDTRLTCVHAEKCSHTLSPYVGVISALSRQQITYHLVCCDDTETEIAVQNLHLNTQSKVSLGLCMDYTKEEYISIMFNPEF